MFNSVANDLTIDLRDSISAVSIEVKSSSVVGVILSYFFDNAVFNDESVVASVITSLTFIFLLNET